MPDAVHMQMARMATSWVRRTLPSGADNNFTTRGETLDADADNRLGASRYLLGQLVASLCEADVPLAQMTPVQVEARERLMLSLTEVTSKLGAGNCYEQAMCAFRWLTGRGVAGVKLVRISMQPYKYDSHVFVIIGEVAEGTKLRDVGDVVFCDPWLAEAGLRSPGAMLTNRRETHGAFDKDMFVEFFEGFRFGKEKNDIGIMLRA